MFNLRSIPMKPKSIYLLISVMLLAAGCALIGEKGKKKPSYRSVYNNMKMIKLSDELSSAVYQVLERETPENALAKQPHTMGDVISGKIICDNEFIDGYANTTEQKCRIIIDTTDRGVGG